MQKGKHQQINYRNGIIVLAFGMVSVEDRTLLNTSQVTLFDTRNNQVYKQTVSGVSPPPRHALGSALGKYKYEILK